MFFIFHALINRPGRTVGRQSALGFVNGESLQLIRADETDASPPTMKGWFDAFRHDGGPTLYDRANRTAVTGDVPTIVICVIFITLFAAFVIVFPGIRREVSVNLFSLHHLFIGCEP